MLQKTKIVFLTILTLILINCGNVFAKTNLDYLNESLEQLGYYNYFNNFQTSENFKIYNFDNNTYYGDFSDYQELKSIINNFDWVVYQGDLNYKVDNLMGSLISVFAIAGGYGESPFNYNYTQLLNTRAQRFYLVYKYNNTGKIQADYYWADSVNTVNMERENFELWIDNEQIKYSNGYIEPIKKAYFEYSANQIGTTNINNNIIPCFYPSSFDTNGNTYATYKKIGKLYIDAEATIDEVYSSIPTIKVQNIEQTKTWEYKNYLIFTDNTIENGYKVYTINIDINYINTPYIYTMELTTRNEELGEDIIIKFVLLTETTGGGIVVESGDTELSGDFTKNNTTLGDIQNTIENIFKEPNEEEIKQEQEENINQIKDQITEDLNNNEVFGALTTAEQGFIELLGGEPGDFKISWNNVKYKYSNKSSGDKIQKETVIIPSGDVNFSKIARENESIGYVKETLNIILSGYMAFNILKYLYNLILTTLGIDNPFVIERSNEPVTNVTKTETIKMKSGRTVTQTTRYKGGN